MRTEVLTWRGGNATTRRKESFTPRLRLSAFSRRHLIVGCGHFGSRAARQLLGNRPDSKITIVDKKKEAFQKVSDLPVEKAVSDGLSYLERIILDGSPIGYVVPAVPFHLAFEFILLRLRPLRAKRVQLPPLQNLPNSMPGETGDLYASFADFLCPDDCPEPSEFCTVTRKKRSKPLYKILLDLKGPFDSAVIRSRQLGPGVGGYRPDALIEIVETIKKRGASDRPFLISTACRCHGVVSALSI